MSNHAPCSDRAPHKAATDLAASFHAWMNAHNAWLAGLDAAEQNTDTMMRARAEQGRGLGPALADIRKGR